MRKFLLPLSLVASLAACGNANEHPVTDATSSATIGDRIANDFKQGCAAVGLADGAFKAIAPALVTAGKLTQAEVEAEAKVIASVNVTCANPPADLTGVAPSLLGQAAGIYTLIAAKPAAPTP